MLARLLYRDGLMLVVDKPAGLPVHRGPKGGDAFEDYFDAGRISGGSEFTSVAKGLALRALSEAQN